VALAGAVEVGLVVRGTYSILDMGQITHFYDQSQIEIGFSAALVIGICIMKKIRGM
jgi:D-serine dehydratase